jgi:hypothetical protein
MSEVCIGGGGYWSLSDKSHGGCYSSVFFVGIYTRHVCLRLHPSYKSYLSTNASTISARAGQRNSASRRAAMR